MREKCRREESREGAMKPRSKQLTHTLTMGSARASMRPLPSLLVPHTRQRGERGS